MDIMGCKRYIPNRKLLLVALLVWLVTLVLVGIRQGSFSTGKQKDKVTIGQTPIETSSYDYLLNIWLERFNDELTEQNHRITLANFQFGTNITAYNGEKFSKVSLEAKAWLTGKVQEGRNLENIKLQKSKPESMKRKSDLRMLEMLTDGSSAKNNVHTNRKMTGLQVELDRISATAKVQQHSLKELEGLIGRGGHRQRLWAWKAWRSATGPFMRPLYNELMQNFRTSARENGYNDMGEIWRENELGESTADLEQMADRLYADIKPLYRELHAYVRRKLHRRFPEQVDPRGFIPAHLLGNMWAQTWKVDGSTPYPEIPKINVTPILKAKYKRVEDLVKIAEDFYTSLGFDKMSESFWRYSMFSRPKDRVAQCHASAYDMSAQGDYRIKMCAGVTGWDLSTLYHEMGHIVYYMSYSGQPAIYRAGANTAFHEAIGDTIKMSAVTPKHLKRVGLLPQTRHSNHSQKEDLNRLLELALGAVAFLPYAYLVDKYRWDVFRGDINQTNYNSRWWRMRESIQGITSPVNRTEKDFDPGAKFHISANMPYVRYFLSKFLQFQFYEALCQKSGHTGEIHNCDFYNSKKAGNALKSMMSYGRSEPWPKLLQMLTGKTEISSQPLLNYFKPLYNWLVKINKQNNKT